MDFQSPKVSKEMKDLLLKMLKYDVNERIKLKDIYNHALFMKDNTFQTKSIN